VPQRHRPELSEAVAGEPLLGYRRTPRTYRSDRVCEAAGCSTKLSIYNDASFCSTHGPHRPWTRRGDVVAPGAMHRRLGRTNGGVDGPDDDTPSGDEPAAASS